jgi:alkanesulfonate monooxygenase SsuD/methylene tetrahydromethanopterin reductase-like flavin-dependent oxidoreductase (luciferase family)
MTRAFASWPERARASTYWKVQREFVRAEDFDERVFISSDPDKHRAEIQRYFDLGFDRIYLHNVGRNQREFLEVFGREVLPGLTR